MVRYTLLRGVSAGALTLVFFSTSTLAQEALPTIDIGTEGPANGAAGPANGPAGDAAGRGGKPSPAKETGYARSTAYGATKTDAPLLDTPVAVQIVPHEVIEDQQDLNVLEVVKNVSGVQASPGTFYDQYNIRGFPTSATYRNGLKTQNLFATENMAFTDRIEIVKGPASVLYGRIDPGGFVNIVTKKPQEEFKASADQQVGNWGLARSTADVTGPLNADKTLLYRLMGVFDHADSWTNFDHRDNGAAALYLTFKPTTNFEFNTQFEYYSFRQTTPAGSGQIPVITATIPYGNTVLPLVIAKPLNLSRGFSASDAAMYSNFPYTEYRTYLAYDWTYKFDDKWKLTNRFLYSIDDERQNVLSVRSFNPRTFSVTHFFGDNAMQRDGLSTNLDLTGEVFTGPVKHELLAGADWFSSVYRAEGFSGVGANIPKLNIFLPNYGSYVGALNYYSALGYNNVQGGARNRDFGVYAQDQMTLLDDRVHVLLGARWDKAEDSFNTIAMNAAGKCFPVCTGYPLAVEPNTPRISPRAGLLYKLTDDTSIYGSYVRSFGTNNGVDAQGNVYAPEQGLQWETGIKKQWLDGKVMTSVTLFDLTKKNVLQADPYNPGFLEPVGTVRSRGVELDASGQVTENLSVIASYTFDSVKITNDNNNGNAGHRLNGAAPNAGSLWAKWDTAPKRPEGWEFGGGIYVLDRRWGDNANTWVLAGYTRFDAMAAYRMMFEGHKITLRLNIKNLTDTKYFEATDAGTNAYYGAPRTFIGSVHVEF